MSFSPLILFLNYSMVKIEEGLLE